MDIKEFNWQEKPTGFVFSGVYSFLERGPLCDEVKKAFGRENEKLALKIFREPFYQEKMEDFYWGSVFCPDNHRTRLYQATIAQNIGAWYGLAPRVYGIVVINYKGVRFLAQLTEDLGEPTEEDTPERQIKIYEELADKLKKHHLVPPIKDIVNNNNAIGGKWFDFQGAKLEDCFEEEFKKRVVEEACFVKGTHYQTQPELGLKGFRDSEQRVKDLRLEEIDFKDKTVLDVGCLGGFFCNYAYKRGAKRVVGVDLPEKAQIAYEISNYLKNWNIDYVPKTINRTENVEEFAGIKKFDIILYLAVNWYLGFPDWLFEMMNDVLIVEKNGKEDGITDEAVEEILKSKCSKVEIIGHRNDFDRQPILRCRK